MLNLPKEQNKEAGSILIYTILIMVVVTTVSVALMRLLVPKFRIVKESVYSTNALYAADSGMEWCILSNRIDPSSATIPGQPTTVNSATILYYDLSNNLTTCDYGGAVGFRIVGTYRGISRSLEAF